MAEIATRQSYGEALIELLKIRPDLVVLDADLAEATKTSIFKKHIPIAILTVESQKQI